jgi:hypothetical protein
MNTGTWTAIVVDPSGRTCILTDGLAHVTYEPSVYSPPLGEEM